MPEYSQVPPPDNHRPRAGSQQTREAASLDSGELLIRLVNGDDAAARVAFDRYVARLVALVRTRLSRNLARRIDAEDVVQSAYRSFFVGAASEKFVHARAGDLWRLLAQIALHKLYRQIERQTAARRAVRRESPEGELALAGAHRSAPSPGEAVALAEQLQLFHRDLAPRERELLTMRLQGASAAEISAKLGKSVRTVRRTLAALQQQLEAQLAARSSVSLTQPAAGARQNDSRAPLEYSDFVIERMIAAGGMGKVYRATQRSTGRILAIKSLHKRLSADPRVVQKFLEEAQILAQLEHPHIVRLEGVGQYPGGGYFFTMEFVDGQNLQQRRQRGRMPPAEAARIVLDVATAVAHANAKGIVHGDLKPANILIDRTRRVVVTDFGLAQFIAPSAYDVARPMLVGGTAGYIAPEVQAGRPPTPAADIFGLGASLQALIVGTPNGPISPDDPELERLARVINRAMSTEPNARFRDAWQFAEALRDAINGIDSPSQEQSRHSS